MDAYRRAAGRMTEADPACGLRWHLLAAIGRVESDHGRFGGAALHADGTSTPKIIGIPLDGVRAALIRDSDAGRLDGDTVLDRAVGPMQFIPTTWARYAVDGNGDGVADPFSVYDAALAAARYLCAAGGELRTVAGRTRAVLAYNDSESYLGLVLALDAAYAGGSSVPAVGGVPVVPVVPAPASPLVVPPRFPPVDPGPPLGLQPGPRSSAGASASAPPASSGSASSGSSNIAPPASSASAPCSGSTTPAPSATPTPATPAPDPCVSTTTAAPATPPSDCPTAAGSGSADGTPPATPSDPPSRCPG
jgi:hypothetical protein